MPATGREHFFDLQSKWLLLRQLRHSRKYWECRVRVVSRQLEKPYLESVPSSEFGPILAVRRTLVAASVTVPARETCRPVSAPGRRVRRGGALGDDTGWPLHRGRGEGGKWSVPGIRQFQPGRETENLGN